MTWLPIYNTLSRHIKTLRAAQKLGIHRQRVAGLLLDLWHWTLECCPNGVIDAESWPLACDAIGWEGSPDQLLSVLATCGNSGCGFLDLNNGDIRIHDWDTYCGRLIEKRENDRKRAEANREKRRSQSVREPFADCSQSVRRNSIVEYSREERTLESIGKIKDRDVVAEKENVPSLLADDADKNVSAEREDAKPKETHAEEADFIPTKKGHKLSGAQLAMFQEFWVAFDFKKERAVVADTWLSLGVTKAMMPEILAGARREAKERKILIAKGRSPKYPQGWLSGRRWEDDPSPEARSDDENMWYAWEAENTGEWTSEMFPDQAVIGPPPPLPGENEACHG